MPSVIKYNTLYTKLTGILVLYVYIGYDFEFKFNSISDFTHFQIFKSIDYSAWF